MPRAEQSLGCPQVGAVVVGFDRHLNYHKIQYATLCISENPGCHFIATNLDAKTHLTDAQEWAGNGAMVGAIKGKLQALRHSAYHFETAPCALPIRGSSQPGGRHRRQAPRSGTLCILLQKSPSRPVQ